MRVLGQFYFLNEKISHDEKHKNAYKRTKTKKAAFLCT